MTTNEHDSAMAVQLPNWKIRFNDGTEQVYAAETIAEAIDECELITGKRVRCAMYQSEMVNDEERAVVE